MAYLGDDQIDNHDERLRERRAALGDAIRYAREARTVFGASFSDSLFSIRRFLEGPTLRGGECLESFDPGWAFGSFDIHWRNLKGRKRPVCYLPIYLPNPSIGVEVVKPDRAMCADLGVEPKDLVIMVKPNPRAPGLKLARRHAESMVARYGEDEPCAAWLR